MKPSTTHTARQMKGAVPMRAGEPGTSRSRMHMTAVMVPTAQQNSLRPFLSTPSLPMITRRAARQVNR